MIFRLICIMFFVFSINEIRSQNDQDALRYSRMGIGGSARFMSMGGAFGALGADLSCASYNPAGLGLYRKGEFVYSGGLKFTNNSSNFNSNKVLSPNAYLAFSNFGLAFSMPSEKDRTKRNTFAVSSNQLQNFNNTYQISEKESSHSIARDMLNLANTQKNVANFNSSYELLGYNTYVLDYDSASNKFFSFVDLGRTVSLNRNITTKGRVNDLNISFAQSADDKYYIGASLGIPRVKFESTTTHSEVDANDSMRITYNSTTNSNTYISALPFFYADKLGFHSLRYQEYFKTDGYGLNLKLGGILRLNKSARIGAYFHTPTLYYLTDTYTYSMEARFDANTTKPLEAVFPDETGKYSYNIITPMRLGLSGGFIINKQVAIGVDIENLNYGTSSIFGATNDVFSGVNAVIKNKYKNATNMRVGGEYNLNPFMLRAGYAMYGSPFGGFFSGPFDRETMSFGVGYRPKSNFIFDVAWVRTRTKEKYYMYSTDPIKVDLKSITTSFVITGGLKF